MRSISYRMLIGIVIAIILMLIVIILVAAALLISTGNPPGGEFSKIYGFVSSLEEVLAGILSAAAEWLDLIAGQIQRLAGSG